MNSQKSPDELAIAYKEIGLQHKEKEQRASELIIADHEREQRTAALIIANIDIVIYGNCTRPSSC